MISAERRGTLDILPAGFFGAGDKLQKLRATVDPWPTAFESANWRGAAAIGWQYPWAKPDLRGAFLRRGRGVFLPMPRLNKPPRPDSSRLTRCSTSIVPGRSRVVRASTASLA